MAMQSILGWMGTTAATNWILSANLVAVGIYVVLTWGIKRASNEQIEALSKPALVLRAVPPRLTLNDNFTEILHRRVLMRAKANGDEYLELVNVGNGPALEVSCVITDRSSPDDKLWSVPAAYVEAGDPLPLPLRKGNFITDKRYKIECSYLSLARGRYESVIELNGEEIERSNFRRSGRG